MAAHANKSTFPPHKTPSAPSCLCCNQHKPGMSHLLFLLLLFSLFLAPTVAAAATELRHGYYSETCPEAESIVRAVIHRAMIRETRSAASVMRLQFHDCFVNGCDGSVLLDDTPTMLGEKMALSNINSLRDFEVIDEVKEALEQQCPGVVSCADIIVMAARDAVVLFLFGDSKFIEFDRIRPKRIGLRSMGSYSKIFKQ